MQAKEQRDTSYEVIIHETFLVDVGWKSCYDNLISKLCHWIIFENYKSTSKQICDELGDLVSFAQFKKLEKRPWRSVTFTKVSLQLYY